MTSANWPVSTVTLYRNKAAKMIHPMGKRAKRTPWRPARRINRMGMRQMESLLTSPWFDAII